MTLLLFTLSPLLFGFKVISVSSSEGIVDSTFILIEVNPKGDEEESMLDQAFDIKNNSRLSCQIPLSEELDGIELELAPE